MEVSKEIVIPAPLRNGDRVAIVSPASKIAPELIDAAVGQLGREGFEPVVMPHAKGECGSFSASAEARVADLRKALEDESVKGVLCSRGGYGAVHLLDELDRLPETMFHKWLIGRRLVGGNLAVLGGLIGTRFDDIEPGCVLFLEDIAEPIYKVERILWQLRLRGVFDRLGGLLIGQFTEYRPSADHASVEEMMERFFRPYSFPRAYGLPMGHIEENAPLLLGATAHLEVADNGVKCGFEL